MTKLTLQANVSTGTSPETFAPFVAGVCAWVSQQALELPRQANAQAARVKAPIDHPNRPHGRLPAPPGAGRCRATATRNGSRHSAKLLGLHTPLGADPQLGSLHAYL